MVKSFNYLYTANLIQAFIELDTIFDIECKKCKCVYHYKREEVFGHKIFKYQCPYCGKKDTFNSQDYLIKYYEEKLEHLKKAIEAIPTCDFSKNVLI